jgi:hypothetical protein
MTMQRPRNLSKNNARWRHWVRWCAIVGNHCWWCGHEMFPPSVTSYSGDQPVRLEATIEHIVPQSLGGKTVASNLALAHECCNSFRNTETWEAWVTPEAHARFYYRNHRDRAYPAMRYLQSIQPTETGDVEQIMPRCTAGDKR